MNTRTRALYDPAGGLGADVEGLRRAAEDARQVARDRRAGGRHPADAGKELVA